MSEKLIVIEIEEGGKITGIKKRGVNEHEIVGILYECFQRIGLKMLSIEDTNVEES